MKKILLTLFAILFSTNCFAAITTLDTSTYDGFSTSWKIQNSPAIILHIFREGTSHAADKGKFVAQKYTCDDAACTTGSWGTRYDIYTDDTYDVRDPVMIAYNGQLQLFFTKYIPSTSQEYSGYIKSTDMTGTSWGSYVNMYTKESGGASGFNFHNGACIDYENPGTFVIPWAKHTTTGPVWQLIFWKTTDGGSTFTPITVYSGSSNWVEPTCAFIGRGRMIATARDNAGNYLGYTKSTDDGDTWTAMTINTRWGNSTSVKPSTIWYDRDYDRIILTYLDRGLGASDVYRYSIANDAFAGFIQPSLNFSVTVAEDSGGYDGDGNGYGITERLSPTKVLIAWSKQAATDDADIVYDILSIGQSTDPKLLIS